VIEFKEEEEQEGKVVSIKAPRLDAVEKLYVRTYLHTLSHKEAHKAVDPLLKSHTNINKYSERDNVRFHINLALQEKTEALSINADTIITRLYHEALATGAGTNQAARIQALQLLGKHLGMFQEKKEDHTPSFTIINYGGPTQLEQAKNPVQIENKKLEILEELPNIQVTNYNKEEENDYIE
jgi:hypothetical protein